MRLIVDSALATAPSRQLVEIVLDAVARGGLEPEARLPSVREAAVQAMVNPNTVAKAWRELAGLGVVYASNGRGVFVTSDGPTLARTLRNEASLDRLMRALDEVLAAGHEPGDVMAVLSQRIKDFSEDDR